MTRAAEGAQESQTDPRSSETRQEESDLISECKCRPRYQPRVPPWLRMPRMCGTNPEDLVRFSPLTFPLLETPLPPYPSSMLLHRFSPLSWILFLHIMFVYSCRPWPSFPLVCSVAPSPIRLCFQHFDCWPLLVLIFPVTHLPLAFFSPCLLAHYLLPLSLSSLRWLRSPDALPLFPFSFSPSSISSPTVPSTRQHWHGCKVHLHLCSRLRWTISMGSRHWPWMEQRYYGNVGKRHVELPPPPSVHCQEAGLFKRRPRLQFEIQPVNAVAQMLVCHHQLKSTIKVTALSSLPQNNIYF